MNESTQPPDSILTMEWSSGQMIINLQAFIENRLSIAKFRKLLKIVLEKGDDSHLDVLASFLGWSIQNNGAAVLKLADDYNLATRRRSDIQSAIAYRERLDSGFYGHSPRKKEADIEVKLLMADLKSCGTNIRKIERNGQSLRREKARLTKCLKILEDERHVQHD